MNDPAHGVPAYGCARCTAAGHLQCDIGIAVVVAVDVLFFRHHFWERLTVNVGIVLVFAAFGLRFLKHS